MFLFLLHLLPDHRDVSSLQLREAVDHQLLQRQLRVLNHTIYGVLVDALAAIVYLILRLRALKMIDVPARKQKRCLIVDYADFAQAANPRCPS